MALLNRFALKGKNLLPIGSKFFSLRADLREEISFRADPFSEEIWCAGKVTGSHISKKINGGKSWCTLCGLKVEKTLKNI